jgi:hypothetical protein
VGKTRNSRQQASAKVTLKALANSSPGRGGPQPARGGSVYFETLDNQGTEGLRQLSVSLLPYAISPKPTIHNSLKISDSLQIFIFKNSENFSASF